MFQCSAKRPRVNVEGPPPVESDYGALSGNLSIWTGEGGTGEGMDRLRGALRFLRGTHMPPVPPPSDAPASQAYIVCIPYPLMVMYFLVT